MRATAAWFGTWMLCVQARAALAFLIPTSKVSHMSTVHRTARRRVATGTTAAGASGPESSEPARPPKRARTRRSSSASSSGGEDTVAELLSSKDSKTSSSTQSTRRRTGDDSMLGASSPDIPTRAASIPMSVLNIVNDGLTLTAEDMHVLVPVNDIVSTSLIDLSQAAADTLSGGGNNNANNTHMRVAMDRFSRTLESVFRTDFSMRVDKANAEHVLGSQWDRSGLPSPSAAAKTNVGAPAEAPEEVLETNQRLPRLLGLTGNKSAQQHKQQQRERAEADANDSTLQEGADDKRVKPEWLKPPWQQGGDGSGRSTWKGGGNGAGKRQAKRWRSRGRRAEAEARARAAEERCLPVLQLVEDLVRDAMFSPISERDIMMSQALSAEFPTTARVRPVFGNMASIFEMLHDTPDIRAGPAAQPIVPFEGKILVFKRGNGVEETKGRLLLKKLDYVQSNAVRWLSQSVTDSIKRLQEQGRDFVSSRSRDVSKRKDAALHGFVERAVAFGIERDTLARFLPVANATEIAARDMLDAALKANGRRATVSLRRYGTRDVNVELEEFSEGGAWPPEDDSWFWDCRKVSTLPKSRSKARKASYADARDSDDFAGTVSKRVQSTVLPRVTLASVLSRQALDEDKSTAKRADGSTNKPKKPRNASIISRLLSKCTIKEPTYEEVVVVYYKRRKDRLRPPPPVRFAWNTGARLGKLGFWKDKQQAELDLYGSDEAEGPGLGLQLRVYRAVPLVSLNAVTPDKRVEVRPQTALRLDLTTVVGLGLVLANLRFDSPVLVVAATASVVLFIIRTVVGYLNTRIRMESFVSRDILDKTMGSNVPVLRHLAEEAAQQKSRHVALVYAALLQCALDDDESRKGTSVGEEGKEDWRGGARRVTSVASVSRHCGAIMKACVGLDWEAQVDVRYWLKELEDLKIMVSTKGDTREDSSETQDPKSLPLALEGPLAATKSLSTMSEQSNAQDEAVSTTATTTRTTRQRSPDSEPSYDVTALNGANSDTNSDVASDTPVVYYRLLSPEAAAEALRHRWVQLVEPERELEMVEPVGGQFRESDLYEKAQALATGDSVSSSEVGQGGKSDKGRLWGWPGRRRSSSAGGKGGESEPDGDVQNATAVNIVADDGVASADACGDYGGNGSVESNGGSTPPLLSCVTEDEASDGGDGDDGYDGGGFL